MVVRDWLSAIMNEMMNGKRAGKREIIFIPSTKLIVEILNIMKKEGYIENYKIEEGKFKKLIIKISKLNVCGSIKPRFFVEKDEFDKYIRRYLPSRHFGVIMVSTSKGIMTHKEAIEKGIGGSLLAYCY
jgi:small subunit ribosomal protein S8